MRTLSALFVVGIFLLTSFCYAHGPQAEKQDSVPPEGIEKIEEYVEIEEVIPVELSSGDAPGALELIGRFHSAVVHFPIAWLVMLLLVDLGTFVFGRVGWLNWGFYIIIGTIFSFVPVFITGFLTAVHIPQDTGIFSLMVVHRNLNVVVAVICVTAFLLRLSRRNKIEGTVKWVYLGLILCSTVLIGISGHIGGKMVRGENFFPF